MRLFIWFGLNLIILLFVIVVAVALVLSVLLWFLLNFFLWIPFISFIVCGLLTCLVIVVASFRISSTHLHLVTVYLLKSLLWINNTLDKKAVVSSIGTTTVTWFMEKQIFSPEPFLFWKLLFSYDLISVSQAILEILNATLAINTRIIF